MGSKSFSSKTIHGGFQDELGFDSFSDTKSSKKAYAACAASHPELILGGGKLYGGSCLNPYVDDADVYIGLDSGMRVRQYFPWESEREITQFLYPITDMCAPTSSKTFGKLVEYVCNQLQEGKKVHVGCIGGHGRTGTLLSAVFKEITGEKDAITKVRKMYCKKAVESTEQITFLHKHFGIDKVDGSKGGGYTPSSYSYGGYSSGSSMKGITGSWPTATGGAELKKASTTFKAATKVWNCVNSSQKLVGALF